MAVEEGVNKVLAPIIFFNIFMKKKTKKGERKKLKKFTYIVIPLIILIIIASFFTNVKLTITILLSLLLLIGYIIYKERIGQQLIIAFLMALALTSYYVYNYTTLNLFIGRINLFPLIAWTFGLVLLREVYERLKGKNRLLKAYAIYIVGLFAVEYIGYYLFNIRWDTNFPSLLNLGIIHGPIGIKVIYLLIGPIYLLITNYLEVE